MQPSTLAAWGRVRSPPPQPWLRRRPLGSVYEAPLPEPSAQPAPPAGRALQLQEIPEALHHPGAARSPGCQGSPKESHMPAGRAARPRHPPPQPGEAATSGRAGAGPAAPSRAPGPAECVAAPAGGYFEREGSGPASVFSAFSWPPARPPPARALGCPRSGEGGSRGGGKRRAAAIRLGLRPGSRPGRRPAAVGTCALGPGGAAGLLIARLAPAAAAGRPLPVRPSSDQH